MSVAIEVENVVKTYPRRWGRPARNALQGVSLQVRVGETFGFIGANGAGKSTLIKILVGAMQPTGGCTALFGSDVQRPEARKGLGFVPENPSLQDHLTPYEVLRMGLHLHRVRVSNEREHCLRWLKRFDLLAVADARLRGFSKGMLQRTVLAHAMAIEPRLLVLDEPLSGLDPVGRKDVVDILGEYRAAGGTIFLTSHVLHDVERLADRFGLIHQGSLVSVQSPGDLLRGEQTVSVRSVGGAAVAGFVQDADGRWRAEVRRDQLWETLGALQSAQHALLEVRPSLTLEDVFFRHLAQQASEAKAGACGPEDSSREIRIS